MGNIHPNIRPNGLSQKDLVDLLYMIVSSLKGICAKLDADGGVAGVAYTAFGYTSQFKVSITDSKGNVTGNTGKEVAFIRPEGIGDPALIELLYQIFSSVSAATTLLDTDGGVADTDYVANCYTAKFLVNVINQAGDSLGNGTDYYFKGNCLNNQKRIVDLLYSIVDAIETLTEQLDADGDVTDTNYEALWFTATILLRIENSTGDQIGVSR